MSSRCEVPSRHYRLHVSLVFAYILITPLNMVEIPGIGSAMKIISFVILLAGILLLISENAVFRFHNRLVQAWTAYVFYTILSIFWSTNFEASLSVAVGMIQVLVISLVVTKFTIGQKDIRLIELAWILTALICLLLFFGGAGQQIEYGGRISIVMGSAEVDPNEFCAYFYMPAAILISRLLRGRARMGNFMYMMLLLAIFYCILSTGSRGGLLATIAAVMIAWMFSTPATMKKIILLCVVAAAAYLIFINLFAAYLPQAVLERFHPASIIADKGSDRTLIWSAALSDIFSGNIRLIFGYGPFGVTFMKYTMHNQFIQVLMDGGLIGLILYLKFVYELFRKAIQNGAIFVGGITGAFVALMTLSAYASFKLIWVIFLMDLLTVHSCGCEQKNGTLPKDLVNQRKVRVKNWRLDSGV